MKKVHNVSIATLLSDWNAETDQPLLDRAIAFFQSRDDISIRTAFEKAKEGLSYTDQERLDEMLENACPYFSKPDEPPEP